MQRIHWFLTVALLLTACSSQSEQTEADEEPTEKPAIGERALHYKVTVDEERDRTLRVEVAFRAGDGDETDIAVPTRDDAETEEPAVTGLEAISEGTEVGAQKDNGVYTVTHAPKSVVRLAYRLRGLPAPTEAANRYGPYALDRGWYFEGRSVFAHPKEMHPGLERPVQLDWRELPDGWQTVDSLGPSEDLQNVETALGAVQRSMFVVGDIEYVESEMGDTSLTVAMLGESDDATEPLSAWTDGAVELVRAQRDFWGTSDLPPYLVALFAPKGCCWSTATTRYQSIATVLARDDQSARKRALHNHVAHEHLHRWIPSKMGSPRPFNAYAWFVEGVTEFYARRFQVRTGAISPTEYVDQINGLLEKYDQSPVQNADRTRVNKQFRRNADITQLAYMQGELLALNWHAAIYRSTDGDRSFDDVMRRLVDRHAEDDEVRLSDETLANAIGEFAPDLDVASTIETHINEGESIELSEKVLGPCAEKAGPTTFEPKEGIDDNSTCREWLSPE